MRTLCCWSRGGGDFAFMLMYPYKRTFLSLNLVSAGSIKTCLLLLTVKKKCVFKHKFHFLFLALIQLSRPAILNRRVSLVCLPYQGYVIPGGKECYATGKYIFYYQKKCISLAPAGGHDPHTSVNGKE